MRSYTCDVNCFNQWLTIRNSRIKVECPQCRCVYKASSLAVYVNKEVVSNLIALSLVTARRIVIPEETLQHNKIKIKLKNFVQHNMYMFTTTFLDRKWLMIGLFQKCVNIVTHMMYQNQPNSSKISIKHAQLLNCNKNFVSLLGLNFIARKRHQLNTILINKIK